MVYMFDWEEYYCRMTHTYVTLYECVPLCMLGVFYSSVDYILLSYNVMWMCGLWSLMLYMWLVHNLRNIVHVLWSFGGVVSSITRWLLLYDHEEQDVHTNISCITISIICSWCQLKRCFSYAPLSMIRYVKYMTIEVWSSVV